MTTQQTEALQCAADLEYSIPRHRIQDAFILNAYKALKMVRTQQARITDLESQLAQRFDAADMATASAQGFRDGAAKEQQAGWQPIETAPANGQCLVWCDTDDGGEVMKLCRDKKGNWLYEGEPTYATGFYIEPTHWREFPPPPSSAQREVSNG